VYGRTTHTTLLARLARGPRNGAGEDPDAWDEFCERYGGLIRSFARRQGVQDNDCDDVLQDVLLALTRDIGGFQRDPARGTFRGFLKVVTLRSVFKRFRQKSPAARPVELEGAVMDASADASIDDQWEAEWRDYHVRQAMRAIESEFGEKDRAAFEHYALAGRSVNETAELLGLTLDQVYQAKSRITRRLSELIAQQVTEEG
jgi:RNA polymerase sigma-70 factor, ECF subfamily